ncbi:hypothetical protein G3I77_27075 [Streptomyces sp. D2-8]|uniref:hypothetical protein n=1 Tax=Streptomyces sp. D2-8 TaxID=2707767 RepID=UPI0020BE324A|nr:hypothetical protein [Streptomyces sp. D2-8]MCK8436551.1 hypothetical protein [Streptomyces sp. D2-8]
MDRLPASVDHDILAHRSIAAIATIHETLGCTVHQAVDAYAQRYEERRRDRPGDFRPSPEEYDRSQSTRPVGDDHTS